MKLKESDKIIPGSLSEKYNQMKLKEPDKIIPGSLSTGNVLAIYNIFETSKDVDNSFYPILTEIQKYSEHIIYTFRNTDFNHGSLHFTLMQVIGFDYFDEKYVHDNLDKYLSIFKKYEPELNTLEIEYNRIIFTGGCVIMCGIPSIDINKIRENIRSDIITAGLRLQEAYKNDIVHTTLIRFKSFENIDLSWIKKYDGNFLLKVKCNNFKFGITDIKTNF